MLGYVIWAPVNEIKNNNKVGQRGPYGDYVWKWANFSDQNRTKKLRLEGLKYTIKTTGYLGIDQLWLKYGHFETAGG